MFEAAAMVYVYVETPLRAGSGRSLGAIDLPLQRERLTGYPIVQASSLKGRLRAEARGFVGGDATVDWLEAEHEVDQCFAHA